MGGPGSGRRPTPTNLRRLYGEKRPSRLKPEPMPPVDEIVVPSYLSAEAREVWARLAPSLESRNVLTPWDRDGFGVYCAAVARHEAAVRLLGDALLVPGVKSALVKHPLLQIIRDSAALIATYSARFGLTPSDRVGLNVGPKVDRDARDELFSGGSPWDV